MTVGSYNVRQDTEEGGTWEGKRSGGWEKANKKEKWRKYLHGWHVTKFLTNFCMFDCE